MFIAAILVRRPKAGTLGRVPRWVSMYGRWVFYKFYADRERTPHFSDAYDIVIASATPYVDAIITENHQAEAIRKMRRRDDFLGELEVFILRDFRGAVPPSGAGTRAARSP